MVMFVFTDIEGSTLFRRIWHHPVLLERHHEIRRRGWRSAVWR
jgi:hypothetical protein